MKANLGLSVAVQDNAQVWLPSPPPVDKPRANYNAASLAYLGDAIYEVYYLILLCFFFLNLKKSMVHEFQEYCTWPIMGLKSW